MIEVKCLKIRFNQLTVLDGIDIVVEQGQVSGDVFRRSSNKISTEKKGE